MAEEGLLLQSELHEKIKKAQKNFKKSPRERINTPYIETRLEQLEEDWTEFKKTHREIIKQIKPVDKATIPYFKEEQFEQAEDLYITYRCELKIILKKLAPNETTKTTTPTEPSTSNKNTKSEVNLPRINIPEFSGKYQDWTSFHDLFDSLINKNESLDDVRKLTYLKASVKGEAQQLLKTITTTSENYKIAWDILVKRYNNKRYLSNCIFKKLFGMRAVYTESAYNIKQLLDGTVECVNSLKNMGLPTEQWDAIIVYMTTSKLDAESQKLWEQYIASEKKELPSFKTLEEFLETRFRSLELVDQTSRPSSSLRPKAFHAGTADNDDLKCTFCKENHYIYQCKSFAKENTNDKYSFVQSNGLCFNCLIPNHSANKCMRNTCCRICKKKHHSLLHPERTYTTAENVKSGRQNETREVNTHFIKQPDQVLLATALVNVTTKKDEKQVYRALIDQGSQASFVTENLVQSSGLKRTKINGVVSGLSTTKTLRINYMVTLEIQSRIQPEFKIQIQAYVLKTITNYLPTEHITVSNFPQLDTKTLADQGYNKPNKIDLLLGAEVYCQIIDTGLMKNRSGMIAQKTHLGWILSGEINSNKPAKNKQVVSMHLCVCGDDLLKKFWEIENETITSDRKMSKEENRCESIYKQTTIKTENNRYKVNLPFKEGCEVPAEKIGRTKEMAIARFIQTERKFKTNKMLKEDYTKVIKEYIELGHMEKTDENNKMAVYLPHHAVVREDKDTSKTRVVFDASAKGSKGVSLNETLLIGPLLQKDLRTLIMDWRRHKIAIVCDIEKMYRQILIADEDADKQRIVWRDEPHEELQSYKLGTVTFGTASAPYLAVRTLIQAAEDSKDEYPEAAEIVKGSFYMDDLMTGCNSTEEALKIYTEVTEILKRGGFTLKKWSSNSEQFLEKIKQIYRDDTDNHEMKLDETLKILGLWWDRKDDKFKFKVKLEQTTGPITKRRILSEVSRLFDPFGWLSPIIIRAKIFIQKLWLSNAGWDESLPEEITEEWLLYRNQLTDIDKVEISRWIYMDKENTKTELHGFADASIAAYASVIYLRVIQGDRVYVTIIESKTKVAPLKQISLAKLELCAAVLLAKRLSEVSKTLNIPINDVYAYTDSMITLSWIQAQPNKWKTFIANRVAEIQIHIDSNRWFHVRTDENSADLASRGTNALNLASNQAWWKGPTWLSNLNLSERKTAIPETKEGIRTQNIKIFHTNTTDEKEDKIWERFSSLTKMVRVLTYCRRIIHLKDKNKVSNTKYLQTNEMQKTLTCIIKTVQTEEFEEELKDLKNNEMVKKKSKIITLSPFIDDEGLLRVGGRIQGAKLPLEVKHPIIIPNKTHLTTLIVRDAHFKTLHGGNRLMMHYIRSRYWIIGLKQMVKKCVRECVICTRHKAQISQPLMGDLPSVRLNPGKPFEATGVDFAGPIQMRTSKGRGHKSFKGYICLFVCMKTRALHLEAVSDLTSQGFIAAFRRFISRRGRCSDMWSDNGLNFVGAAKELKDMLKKGQADWSNEVAESLANDGTNWHFIPPRAPNFGGLWESGVKSVKTHLNRIIGNSTLTFEEMTTLLTQIEACLNSRPIGQLTDNPDDLMPLTPAHFLVGEALITLPDQKQNEQAITQLNRWKLVQTMTQHFWQRWSKDFLYTIQQRYKWQRKTQRPMIGDVVLVRDEDLPPAKWLMGRITEIHAGHDEEVRVVTVKCKNSHFKRPISKVILFPRDN